MWGRHVNRNATAYRNGLYMNVDVREDVGLRPQMLITTGCSTKITPSLKKICIIIKNNKEFVHYTLN